MDILQQNQHTALLEFLAGIKARIKDWLIVVVRLTDMPERDFTIIDASHLVATLFKERPGKLYICKDEEIVMLMQREATQPVTEISERIEKNMRAGSCQIAVQEGTPEGMARLEMLISYKAPKRLSLLDVRRRRKENIVLVADDDMFQRDLIKKALGKMATIIEAESGDKVEAMYRQHNPDLVFLDIHMPGKSGRDLVYALWEIDPDSYIVMVTADDSQENRADTWQKGARDFITKPLSKIEMMSCVRKCETILL